MRAENPREFGHSASLRSALAPRDAFAAARSAASTSPRPKRRRPSGERDQRTHRAGCRCETIALARDAHVAAAGALALAAADDQRFAASLGDFAEHVRPSARRDLDDARRPERREARRRQSQNQQRDDRAEARRRRAGARARVPPLRRTPRASCERLASRARADANAHAHVRREDSARTSARTARARRASACDTRRRAARLRASPSASSALIERRPASGFGSPSGVLPLAISTIIVSPRQRDAPSANAATSPGRAAGSTIERQRLPARRAERERGLHVRRRHLHQRILGDREHHRHCGESERESDQHRVPRPRGHDRSRVWCGPSHRDDHADDREQHRHEPERQPSGLRREARRRTPSPPRAAAPAIATISASSVPTLSSATATASRTRSSRARPSESPRESRARA